MASVSKRRWTHNGEERSAWVVRYTDQCGKRRMKTFDKKKDADAYRVRAQAEIERGEHIPGSQAMTVAEVCDLYMREAAFRLKEGAIGRARFTLIESILRNHVAPAMGRLAYADLTTGHVERWYRGLQCLRADYGADITTRTRRAYLQELVIMEQFAKTKKVTFREPASEFRRTLRGRPKAKIQTFAVEAVKALLLAAEERPHYGKLRAWKRIRLAVHLALFCGLRRGEIYGLTLGAIDFLNRVLRVRTSLTAWRELKAPKTASGVRDVPMPDHVAAMISEWVERFYVENEMGLLLTGYRGGGQMAARGVDLVKSHQAEWRKLLIRAGLHSPDRRGGKGLHFHALRHFAASWYMSQGMAPADVAKLLGHSSFDMTLQVYAHPVYDDSYRRAAINDASTKLIALAAPNCRRDNRATTASKPLKTLRLAALTAQDGREPENTRPRGAHLR